MLHCSCFAAALLAFSLLTYVPTLSSAQPFRGVNLGNWLVTEGWMEPSRFDGIPNKDLLDGTYVQFKSTKLKRYLSADQNISGTPIVAHQLNASVWETFRLWRINATFFNFRSSSKKFVGLEGHEPKLVAVSPTDAPDTVFQIIRKHGDPNRIRLRAANGKFLQARSEKLVTADYSGLGWEDNNPSVFEMAIVYALQGEYQLANGYGPKKARQITQDRYKNFITDKDFRFMSEHGINAVRIPVGWWTIHDPAPPKPFVAGSLQALDNAFKWAEKYGIKVIVDLHAPKTSQNGAEHSASRDGFPEWGEASIPETVEVIDFFASRYANRSNLAAIELMNEPNSPGVELEPLKKYYQAGYDAVRKYTQDAYVIFSQRLGPNVTITELLPFASRLSHVVIDLHYYNLFSDKFENTTVDWNLNYVRIYRGGGLRYVTTSNGPLSFIGEWTGEWAVKNATKEDYQKFVKVQEEVYKSATFGWAYWTYKCDPIHWSFRWMVENNYLNVTA